MVTAARTLELDAERVARKAALAARHASSKKEARALCTLIEDRNFRSQHYAQDMFDDLGIDAICYELLSGRTMTAICEELHCGLGSLFMWLDADASRSARANLARARGARLWDEQAQIRLETATDHFELAKARELASHFRWRASKLNPREYGDRLLHSNSAGDGDQITKVEYSWAGPPLPVAEVVATPRVAAPKPPTP